MTTTKQLLQKGDRIAGKSAKGTEHVGSFEGYTTDSKEWVRCSTGEKTIALDPLSVSRVPVEPAGNGKDSTRLQPTLFPELEDELKPVKTIWTPQYGDRVRGESMDGNPDQGIITRLGAKYAILDNQQRRNVKVDSLELLQAQAVPEDLLYLVGLPWSEQVDQLFSDRGISNLANFTGTEPDLTFFESWRGWIVRFNGGTEVHLAKTGQPDRWFFALSKHPKLRGNGDISQFCHKAIDAVEDAIAQVEAGENVQESAATKAAKTPNFEIGDRIRITHSDTPADIGRLGIVQPPWDSQQKAAESLKVLLDGDEVCRAFPYNAVEVVGGSNDLADRLATEIEAIWAEAEEAENTMRNAGNAALARSLALGEKLLEAKALPEIGGYGKWLPWLSDRGITERKAQRAIRLWNHRQQLQQPDSMMELTLTEALAAISKKTLMPAENSQNSKLKTQNPQDSLLTPESIETQFAVVGDHATPTLEQLMTLYSQIGTIRRWKKGFAVEREDLGAPFPLAFQNRASAWKRWQEEWRSFAVEHPLAATAIPSPDLPATPEKTDGLEGENRASDSYEYGPIDPTPVWFNLGGDVVEGQAIAANGKGFVRIVWGEGRESDVPRDRVSWSDPATTTVSTETEVGLEVCQPSITPEEFNREMWGDANPAFRPVQPNGLVDDRPACSRWEPEEVDNVARIQLQGLLKHLEPAELVKAAIVHSGASVVDAVRVAVEMADYNTSGAQIYEVVTKHPNCIPF